MGSALAAGSLLASLAPLGPVAEMTSQEWMWSGGLIQIALLLGAVLGAFWLVGRRKEE